MNAIVIRKEPRHRPRFATILSTSNPQNYIIKPFLTKSNDYYPQKFLELFVRFWVDWEYAILSKSTITRAIAL
jgi:hypothetical protein